MNDFIRRYGIGFDSLFSEFDRLGKQSGFPFWNMLATDDGYTLQVALAGYSKKDVKVELINRSLIISSDGVDTREVKYLSRGFTQRPFELKFTLAPETDVTDVSMSEGILSISLVAKAKEKNKVTFEITDSPKEARQLLQE